MTEAVKAKNTRIIRIPVLGRAAVLTHSGRYIRAAMLKMRPTAPRYAPKGLR